MSDKALCFSTLDDFQQNDLFSSLMSIEQRLVIRLEPLSVEPGCRRATTIIIIIIVIITIIINIIVIIIIIYINIITKKLSS